MSKWKYYENSITFPVIILIFIWCMDNVFTIFTNHFSDCPSFLLVDTVTYTSIATTAQTGSCNGQKLSKQELRKVPPTPAKKYMNPPTTGTLQLFPEWFLY